MAKAIGYLRVSSANQAKDGRDGFPRQRVAIRSYCTGKRIELVEEHEDAGVSGTVPLEGREGLSTALARCVEIGAGVLVVEKADRLGRDLIVSEMAVRAFAEAGVSIVTADTGQSLTDADNEPSRTADQCCAATPPLPMRRELPPALTATCSRSPTRRRCSQ